MKRFLVQGWLRVEFAIEVEGELAEEARKKAYDLPYEDLFASRHNVEMHVNTAPAEPVSDS